MRFLLALLLAAPAVAQTPPPAIAIQAGRLLADPMKPPRGPSTVVVRGDRVEAVLDGWQAPPGARVVDQRANFVLPGLIDCHVHLESDAGGTAGLVESVTESPGAMALQAQWNGMKTLRAGFTTVRNLGDATGATLALRDAVAMGRVMGPRIVDAGQAISVTAGHMDATLPFNAEVAHAISEANLCDGPDACRRAVRVQLRRGVDVIKIATTGGVNSGTGRVQQMFEDEARAIVETAHMAGKKVAVHAHGTDGINLALRVGADSIEHGTMIDDVSLPLFRRAGAFYVPTLSTVNGYRERLAADPNAYPPAVLAQVRWRLEVTGRALEKAVPAGVRIAFGTDAGVSKHGRNADEFELMVAHGMTPATAIQAATVNAAELLGLPAEIGRIAPGMSADLVAVAGDPLADVRALKSVRYVMARGRAVPLED